MRECLESLCSVPQDAVIRLMAAAAITVVLTAFAQIAVRRKRQP